MKKRINNGFTMVELLIVIVLIGILISISFTGYVASQRSARDGKRKADLEQIRAALEMYRSDVGSYPVQTSSNWFTNNMIAYGSDVYLSAAPNDPVSSYKYFYSQSSPNSYSLCARLESLARENPPPTPPSGCSAQTSCGDYCNYKVTNP